jgi:sodium/hydrogen antiporter
MSSFTSHSRAPVAAAVVCLGVGMLAGAWDARLGARAMEHARSAQLLSEMALLVCLFCTGMRIAAPLDLATWRVPLRLALLTLPVTVVLVAGAANVFLGLPFAQALLLGAVLAPTDPVLASDLKIPSADREDAVRFSLTAEGALSSTLALPIVLFALGVCGHHDLGPLALRWFALDVLWALASGALLGWLLGSLGAHALARLDSRGSVSRLGLTELTLFASVFVFTCGASGLAHANGFVAVLVAGSVLARGGRVWPRARARSLSADWKPHSAVALGSAAGRVGRLAELAMVIVLGALLTIWRVRPALILFALLTLVAVRPLAARLALRGDGGAELERQLVAWFGIRGVPSMYYVMFAVEEGLGPRAATELTAITLGVLATSIALHGLTALPLANKPVGQRS